MANQLSPELIAQLYAQDSGDPLLALFTLDHPLFSGPKRLVNNTTEIISRGETFSPFPVNLVLPPDDGENERVVSVSFDNVSLELLEEIRTVTTGIEVKIEMVLASIPNEVQYAVEELNIAQISYDSQKINCKLVMDDFLNSAMTSEKYTPTTHPGLF